MNNNNNQSSSSSSPNNKQQLIQQQQNQVKVHAWFASVPSLCKTIWLMAVSQHQFYLDRKQSKANMLKYKSLTDLSIELNTSNLIVVNPPPPPPSHSQITSATATPANDGLSRVNSSKWFIIITPIPLKRVWVPIGYDYYLFNLSLSVISRAT